MNEVDLYLEYCTQGEVYTKNINEKLSVDNLGDAINTPNTEYAPVIHTQEKYLVFTATNLSTADVETVKEQTVANEDIYVSDTTYKKTNGQLEDCQMVHF